MTFLQAQAGLRRWTVRAVRPGLGRTQSLLAFLHHPDRAFPTIHITGTNGKGSVTALLASALQSAGYRVGRFTSPHLADERERIAIQGRMISRAQFTRAVARLLPKLIAMHRSGRPATQFEAWTALAADSLRDSRVDIAVVEVGMGGRLDATTAWQRRVLTILTNVGLEHTEILGTTKAAICREKLGISLPGVWLLSAERDPKLRSLMRAWMRHQHTPIRFVGPGARDDLRILNSQSLPSGVRLDAEFQKKNYRKISVPLRGEFQIQNASLACLAVKTLNEIGFSIPDQAWRQGFASAVWPGRMELVWQHPKIYLDGGHNPAGLLAATSMWRQSGKKVNVIVGLLQDKDARSMCSLIAPIADKIYTVTPAEEKRALSAEILAGYFHHQHKLATPCANIKAALKAALSAVPRRTILVIGSLYLIEPARRAVKAILHSSR